MSMDFRSPNLNDLTQMISLFAVTYEKEKAHLPFLMPQASLYDQLKHSLTEIINHGVGCVMESDHLMVGYIIGYQVEQLFGSDLGIYVPLYGYAAVEGADVSAMYAHVANIWVKENRLSHAITLFSHNQASINQWFDLGFGKRCVDALTEVNRLPNMNKSVKIHKVHTDQLFELTSLHQQHNRYYRQSPIFMPTPNEDAFEDLMNWLSESNHHLWMAKDNQKVIGYMRIEPNGESLISNHPSVMNITGAYVDPNHRNQHIAHELLRHIMLYLENKDVKLLGVDYESINPQGDRFWKKYFIPYTYSLTRRIDDRIISHVKAQNSSED